MCVGIPMRVESVEGAFAWCEGRVGRRRIDTLLVGEVAPGDWLLTFLDGARERLSAERAGEIDRALDALDAALSGIVDPAALDAFFPDLAGREPELPEFLRPATKREV